MLKKFAVFLYAIVLLLFSINVFASMQRSAVVFLAEAEGTGTTIEDARKNALINLSQSIYAEVNSSLKGQDALQADGKATSSAQHKYAIETLAYFSGVSFSSPQKQNINNKKLLLVKAVLNQVGYKTTIDNIARELKIEQINFLSDYDMKQQLSKAKFLSSLMTFGKAKNIDYKNELSFTATAYVRDLEYRLSMAAQVSFNIIPFDENTTILLDGQRYKPKERVFLPEGEFSYTVMNNKYLDVKGSFQVDFKDKITIDVVLQEKLEEDVKIKVDLNLDKSSDAISYLLEEEQIRDFITLSLSNLQLVADNNARALLKIDIKKPVQATFSGMEFTTLPVSIILKTPKGNVLLAKELKLTNVIVGSQVNYDNLVKEISKELSKALAGDKIKSLVR